MLLVMRWSSLSQSAFAALRRRVTCRRTKGMETVLEAEAWAAILCWAWRGLGERMASGENTRGLGGCRLWWRLVSDIGAITFENDEDGTAWRQGQAGSEWTQTDIWGEKRRGLSLIYLLPRSSQFSSAATITPLPPLSHFPPLSCTLSSIFHTSVRYKYHNLCPSHSHLVTRSSGSL